MTRPFARHYERKFQPRRSSVVRAIYESGRTPRRSGYITQSLIDRWGSREAALAWLEQRK